MVMQSLNPQSNKANGHSRIDLGIPSYTRFRLMEHFGRMYGQGAGQSGLDTILIFLDNQATWPQAVH